MGAGTINPNLTPQKPLMITIVFVAKCDKCTEPSPPDSLYEDFEMIWDEKTKKAMVKLTSCAFVSLLLPASPAVAQIDLCVWYPGTPECRCRENPFDVVCSTVQTQPPPWETYRDEVPPPPMSDGVWILPLPSNPIGATCTSDAETRYHYAYYAILNRWYNGDVEYMEANEWHDTGFTFNVVFPNGTSYETYQLTRRGGEDNINVIAPWDYQSVQCWWPYIPTN